MKKSGILNARLASIVGSMGHTDLLVVADAGLPVPPTLECIDLAVTAGVPRLLEVLAAIAGELAVEHLTLADELLTGNEVLPGAIRALFPGVTEGRLPHAEFERLTGSARAVVRSGEVTPYANVILRSGVVF